MNAILSFWQWLYYLAHVSTSCVAVTQSTHSTPATEQPVVYGGNCLEAFLISLYSHGAVAWEWASGSFGRLAP